MDGSASAAAACIGETTDAGLPQVAPYGRLESVATFDGPMPTGVAVSDEGRIFVNFPRWGDRVDFTVAELRDGTPVAYPNAAMNPKDPSPTDTGFISVQSVVVDAKNRLWVLDTGSPEFRPNSPGGPKLVGIDLKTNQPFVTITYPTSVVLPTSYTNDVRFDLRRGKSGMAFITDSAPHGGIIVVDLDSKRSWRRLHNHPSTRAEPSFLGIVEGRPLYRGAPGKEPTRLAAGSDGIAISADGKHLYYSVLAGRHLYRVSVDVLANEKATDAEVAATIEDLGEKGASDGLESDAEGRVYATSYEGNAILRREADGMMAPLVADARLLWPDTLSLAKGGWLYVTANQLHRQAAFRNGHDDRTPPYLLFRIHVDGTPIRMP
ncbi:hypothetical protein AKJ09_00233 [Labilithrix luteola]|uniref:Gluconolactonase n=1 Tax=Labilithrix luteola TaxID=1391654 RepID=A0A0K1PKD3_9BACT|nr:hypothetical protein AKJ09_00233 [Labilithrix luteola]